MKRTNLKLKLQLDKTTVRLLESEQLSNVVGAGTNTVWGGCSGSCTNGGATTCDEDATRVGCPYTYNVSRCVPC